MVLIPLVLDAVARIGNFSSRHQRHLSSFSSVLSIPVPLSSRLTFKVDRQNLPQSLLPLSTVYPHAAPEPRVHNHSTHQLLTRMIEDRGVFS